MFEGSSIAERECQPMVAYCGREAQLHLDPSNLSKLHHLKFNKLDAVFSYDIFISRFDSMLFSEDLNINYAFMIQTSIKSDSPFDVPYEDANVFLENNLDDLIEYFIILPRMFKEHRRYVLDMERDSTCSFGDFTVKVELWKKAAGIR